MPAAGQWSNSTLSPAADDRRYVRPAQFPCKPVRSAGLLSPGKPLLSRLTRLLRVRAPTTDQRMSSSVCPPPELRRKPNGIHTRRGHQAPAPAGCRTLSEYGEQLIIRRVKHKLKQLSTIHVVRVLLNRLIAICSIKRLAAFERSRVAWALAPYDASLSGRGREAVVRPRPVSAKQKPRLNALHVWRPGRLPPVL